MCYYHSKIGKQHSAKTIQKMRHRHKNRKYFPAIKCKWCDKEITEPYFNQIFCNKICFNSWQKGRPGRPHTLESRKLLSDSKKGKKLGKRSEEFRQKCRDRRKGKTYEELYGIEKANHAKKLLAESASRNKKGKTISQKQKDLISAAMKIVAKKRYEDPVYYQKILYHLRHIPRSSKLTGIEIILFDILKIDFPDDKIVSQYRIGTFAVDWAIPSKKMAFEADGEYWHKGREEADQIRSKIIESFGWTIVRYEEKFLRQWAKQRKNSLSN